MRSCLLARRRPSRAPPGEQLPIPAAPRRLLQVPASLAPGVAIVPTEGGGYVTIQESPKVIGSGDDEVEVRRLAPAEKARRRFRKGIFLWTFCLLVLIVVFYFLTR